MAIPDILINFPNLLCHCPNLILTNPDLIGQITKEEPFRTYGCLSFAKRAEKGKSWTEDNRLLAPLGTFFNKKGLNFTWK